MEEKVDIKQKATGGVVMFSAAGTKGGWTKDIFGGLGPGKVARRGKGRGSHRAGFLSLLPALHLYSCLSFSFKTV